MFIPTRSSSSTSDEPTQQAKAPLPPVVICLILFVCSALLVNIVGAVLRVYIASSELTATISIVIVLLLFAVLFLHFLKVQLVQAIALDLRCIEADAEEFPALDTKSLQRYTAAFESIGFVQTMDYSVTAESTPVQPAFARLLAHHEHHCLAEINQFFPPGRQPAPPRCLVMSFMEEDSAAPAQAASSLPESKLPPPIPEVPGDAKNEFDESWSLTMTDREPEGLLYLLRRPRSLVIRDPEATPAQLLHAHLERRRHIVRQLGLHVATDVTPATFFARCLRINREQRRILERKNIFVGLIEAVFIGRKNYEWLGDYPQAARRRQKP